MAGGEVLHKQEGECKKESAMVSGETQTTRRRVQWLVERERLSKME